LAKKAKVLVLLDCRGVRGIQFTLRFGKAITIAARIPGTKPGGARQAFWDFWGSEPQATTTRRLYGTRASANTSGPNLNRRKSAGEIADLWIRTDEENFFLLPNRFSKRASPVEKSGLAV
jgi:hypothetical protein